MLRELQAFVQMPERTVRSEGRRGGERPSGSTSDRTLATVPATLPQETHLAAEGHDLHADLTNAPLGGFPTKNPPQVGLTIEGPQANEVGPPSLDVHTLGVFRVFGDNRPVEDWPNGKSKSVLKYLVAHRQRPVARDVLMDLFWPAAGPDAARNSLNVAIYGVRKALSRVRPAFSYVLFRDGCYGFNPEVQIWVDAEAFMHQFSLARDLDHQGREEQAVDAYRAAEILYQGDFLSEDRYEDWLVPLRQRLCDDYVAVLARLSRFRFERGDYESCVRLCERMLAVDSCNEEAYRCVMRCYLRLGQPHLAVRQYHACVATLDRELKLAPGRETSELFAAIRRGERL